VLAPQVLALEQALDVARRQALELLVLVQLAIRWVLQTIPVNPSGEDSRNVLRGRSGCSIALATVRQRIR